MCRRHSGVVCSLYKSIRLLLIVCLRGLITMFEALTVSHEVSNGLYSYLIEN